MADGKFDLVSIELEHQHRKKARASVKLSFPDGQLDQRVAEGSGMVAATFQAFGFALGNGYDVEDYSVRALGKGADALGECSLILINGSRRMGGIGRDHDIVIASALAYLDALNKLHGYTALNVAGERGI